MMNVVHLTLFKVALNQFCKLAHVHISFSLKHHLEILLARLDSQSRTRLHFYQMLEQLSAQFLTYPLESFQVVNEIISFSLASRGFLPPEILAAPNAHSLTSESPLKLDLKFYRQKPTRKRKHRPCYRCPKPFSTNSQQQLNLEGSFLNTIITNIIHCFLHLLVQGNLAIIFMYSLQKGNKFKIISKKNNTQIHTKKQTNLSKSNKQNSNSKNKNLPLKLIN